MTTEPPRPFHRWACNEQPDRPLSFDRCLACGVRRFPNEPEAVALAAGPCPKAATS